MTNVRYWIGVASREHVRLGVKGGFAQFSHGKLAPARRPSQGDWVIYYSPKLRFGEAEPCQKFVAIGQVTDDEPFQVEQFPGFKPWRRKIRYERAAEADIRALIERLSFIKNKTKWGAAFRFGFFEISKSDFRAIAKRMLGRRAASPDYS
jgi:EVE domain